MLFVQSVLLKWTEWKHLLCKGIPRIGSLPNALPVLLNSQEASENTHGRSKAEIFTNRLTTERVIMWLFLRERSELTHFGILGCWLWTSAMIFNNGISCLVFHEQAPGILVGFGASTFLLGHGRLFWGRSYLRFTGQPSNRFDGWERYVFPIIASSVLRRGYASLAAMDSQASTLLESCCICWYYRLNTSM